VRAAAAQFSQVWVNATETHTQEQAVMEAILTKGPMTVSVNAEGNFARSPMRLPPALAT
jgi:hypothetical protein